MNTLEDLRATLHGRANEVEHRPEVARAAAVHQRVAVVRRQRRAVVAGVVAAVLAVVGGVALMPERRPPDPAERRLAGHLAPETIDSLGYTFTFDRGFEGENRRRVSLEASREPRIVAWASSVDDLRLRSDFDLDGDGAVPDTMRTVSDFSDWMLVRPGDAGWVQPRSSGTVAVAVYTLSARPEGLTKDDMTWRQQVPGGRLVGAEIGDRGQSEVTLTVTLPEGRIGFGGFCHVSRKAGAGELGGPWVSYLVDGEPVLGGGDCVDPRATYDLFAGLLTPSTDGIRAGGKTYVAGDTVTVTARLTDGSPSARLIEDPGTRLAMALYAVVDGDDVLERDGHLWRLASTETVTGEARFTAPEGWVLPVLTLPDSGPTSWVVRYGGDVVQRIGVPVRGSIGLTTLAPWRSREIRLTTRSRDAGTVTVDLYVRAD